MKHYISLKTLPLLLACFLFISISASAQDTQTNNLSALLNTIPLSSFKSGWLSYVDFKLLAERHGVILPHSIQDAEGLNSEQLDTLFSAFMSISAGPADILRRFSQKREMLLASGVDFFSVRRALEIGMPAARQLWLEGEFDEEAISEALFQRGYMLTENEINGRQTWAPAGDIEAGSRIDFNKRDPAFLFGGDLGQSWPVTLLPGVLASTPDALSAQAIALGETPSLMENTVLMSGVSAVLQQGDVAQMYALTPEVGGLVIANDNALPRYELILLAHMFTGDMQRVLIALVYADANAAANAGRILTSRLSEDITLTSGEKLQSLISQRGGEIEPLFVYNSASNPVLLAAFHFPLPLKAQREPSISPFRLFSDMLLMRDLSWLETAEKK